MGSVQTNIVTSAAFMLALCVVASDACAWGLGTHVYFAESLTSLTLAVPALMLAVKRFPQWVMAGACLPDLALFGRHCGTQAFDGNHQWATAHRLLDTAQSDEARAAATGYASHLFIDVIAHNHFVPSHEQRWLHVPRLTHAAAEWAMDVHLGKRIRIWPAEALQVLSGDLADYISDSFSCPAAAAKKTLTSLIRGERLLRAVRLPECCYGLALGLDRGLAARFDDYLAVTEAALPRIDHVLADGELAWHPEGAGSHITPLDEL